MSEATTPTSPETTVGTLFATRAEAEAAKPAGRSKHLKIREVFQHGTAKGFIWSSSCNTGLAMIAKLDGYTVGSGGKAVTKAAVAQKLAEFSDAELAELGLSRKAKAKK